MKIRLTQKHYETYTGQMGITNFVDGLSTTDVLPNVAGRMAAVMQCEWEDGTPANVAQVYQDNMHTEAPIASEERAAEKAAADQAVQEQVVEAQASLALHTAETLGAIADEQGITGLRAIAEPFGIKSNSIGGLIEALLKAGVAQPGVEAVAEVVVEEVAAEVVADPMAAEDVVAE